MHSIFNWWRTTTKKKISDSIRRKIRNLVYSFRSLLMYGNRYRCSCCGKGAWAFVSHGYPRRKNARCPHCLSLERTRILYLYITNEIYPLLKKENKKVRVLHFAPEQEIKKLLRNSPYVSEYVDADINPLNATHQMDIMNIPCQDQSFDFIICSHVLYAVPDDSKAMTELSRVLAPGGIFLLIDTICGAHSFSLEGMTEEEKRAYGDEYSMRVYGEDIVDTWKSYGLKVQLIDYEKELSPRLKSEQCLENAFDARILRIEKPD